MTLPENSTQSSSSRGVIEKDFKIKTLNFLHGKKFSFKKRLIDTNLFYSKGSEIGNSERYNRGKTIHTINVWWARRPLSTMRALIYASVIHEVTDEHLELFDDLAKRIVLPEEFYQKAHKIVKKSNQQIKLLDPFGGNGTIAFEASNLGLETYTMDINEYAYFIQKSLLNYGFHYKEDYINELLAKHGSNILTTLTKETDCLFPARINKFTNYIWTYELTCSSCHKKYNLAKRKYLSKKRNRSNKLPIGLVYEYTSTEQDFFIKEISNPEEIKRNNWRKNLSHCPFCQTANEVIFSNLTDSLLVGVKLKEPFGKEFIKHTENLFPHNQQVQEKLQYYIKKYDLHLPTSIIEKWSGIVNPGIYGMESHSDIFNERQKTVMVILIGLMIEEYNVIKAETSTETATFIISVLTGLIDQLIDWNCRLSIWISENEQVGRAFCGPGIPMLWDYNELDPVSKGPANLWDKLHRIINAKKSFVDGSSKPQVYHAKVQHLPFTDDFFDGIITDPPYYDNIFYSVLSNFFYTWKKVLMEKIDPELFSNSCTTTEGELVSSTFRSVDAHAAHQQYIMDFSKAINEIERVLKQDGIFALIYGHSAIEGWLPILESFRTSTFYITSVQPLRIERLHRPRSMKSNASNSVVVIIARKFTHSKHNLSLSDLLLEIDKICDHYICPLQEENWSTFEIGIPVFANCIGLLSNHSSIIDDSKKEMNTTDILNIVIKKIQKFLPDFTIKNRKSL